MAHLDPRSDARSDALKALIARGIPLPGETRHGLLMRYSSPSSCVPIATYEKPLLDWYLNSSGRGSVERLVMKLGLRNAIFSIEPGLAKVCGIQAFES